MDMKKLCEQLTTRDDLKDIPLVFIFQVAYAIFEIIDDGKCFYDTEEKECLSSTTPTQLEDE